MKRFMQIKTVILLLVALFLATAGVNAQKSKRVVSKARSVAAKPAVNRPKVPIDYVAEYNSGLPAELNNTSKYENRNASQSHVPNGTHMPTIEEWVGVFPTNGVLAFEEDSEVLDNYEVFKMAGEMYTVESDYLRNYQICYGLRFKDEENSLLCAYRYHRVGRWIRGSMESGVEVKVVYLGPSFTGSLQTIANEAWWKKNEAKAIRRYFPAPGFRRVDYPGQTDSQGELARYWTTEPNIVLQITFEGVSSGKFDGHFESVTRPFINK